MDFNNGANVRSADKETIDEESPRDIPSNRRVYDLRSGNHLIIKEKDPPQIGAPTGLRNSNSLFISLSAPVDANSFKGGGGQLNKDFMPASPLDDDFTLEKQCGNDDDESLLSNDVSATFTEEAPSGDHKLLLESLMGEMDTIREIIGRHERRIVKVEDTVHSTHSTPSRNQNCEVSTETNNNLSPQNSVLSFPSPRSRRKSESFPFGSFSEGWHDDNQTNNGLSPQNSAVLQNFPPPRSKHKSGSFFRSFKSEGWLDEDTFTLMMIKKSLSSSWILGMFAYSTQIGLGVLVLMDQASQSDQGTPFNIPVRITNEVRIGQFFSLIIYIASQKDILASIQNINVLHYHTQWHKVIDVDEEDRSLWLWIERIMYPNLLRLSQGILVTVISFVLISQSSNLVDLLKDFSALMILSEIDNIFFNLARYGYLGEELAYETSLVQEGISLDAAKQGYIGTNRRRPNHVKGRFQPDNMRSSFLVHVAKSLYSFRSVIFASLTGTMVALWFIGVSMKQLDGSYFRAKYDMCDIESNMIKYVGDGQCDGGYLNSPFCGLDGGDCFDHIFLYPNCMLPDVSRIGDGICDDQFNIPECGYDQNDCCPYDDKDSRFGDGMCHGGYFSSGFCYYDRSDCDNFQRSYPLCPLNEIAEQIGVDGTLPILGDGICDSIIYYMTEECGYEGGDCSGCNVTDYGLLGNGICDGGEYNTEECLWDGSDCLPDAYPNCRVDIPSFIGDGICHGGKYMTGEGCDFDGLDCQLCDVADGTLVGNGICNDNIDGYNVKGCSWDGQDCNYALGRHTEQSSALQSSNQQQEKHTSNMAVDGNFDRTFTFITEYELNPWWKVYLSGFYSIEAVVIYAGPESSCQNHLSAGFQVEILKAGIPVIPAVLINGTSFTSPRIIVEIPLDVDSVGNEVLISLPGNDKTLCLSEVEVYGQLTNDENVTTNSGCGNYNNKRQDYRGNINVTISGLQCQRWNVQSPQPHYFTPETYPFSDLAENFCRNPSFLHDGPWCYTTDAEVEWEYCDVPACPDYPNIAQSKVAWQSSTSTSTSTSTFTSSDKEVDDDLTMGFSTSNEPNPWWRVHLNHQYLIDLIVLHNEHGADRNDLSGYRVDIFNLGNYSAPVFSYSDKNLDVTPDIVFIDIPKGIIGNEVMISLPNKTKALHLRKVEVYGELKMLNAALSGPVERLKVSYYDNLIDYSSLPHTGLTSLAPYMTDVSIGNIIESNDGIGEVWTSGRTNGVAARFVGFALFEAIGTYKICILSDDSSKVYFDDELILDSETALVSATDVCHNVINAESALKKIVVEYIENTGDSLVELKWITPGTSRQMALPFFHSSFSDYPTSQPTSQPTLQPSVSSMPSIYPTVSQQPSESSMPTMAVVDVIIELLTDNYPYETSWSLIANDDEGELIASGPSVEVYQSNTIHYFTVSLNRCTSYSFKVNDTYGDGLNRPAFVEVKVASTDNDTSFGRIGGNFGLSKTIEINVCGQDDLWLYQQDDPQGLV